MIKNPGFITTIIWPAVVLIIALAAFYIKPWQTKTDQTISVTSTGTTQVTPNVAEVTATVETTNPNIDTARAQNQEKVSALIAKLKELGIAEKDIKTENISAGQSYSQDIEPLIYPAPKRPNTNQFSTSLEVTIRDFQKADQIIAALTQNGATNLYGPSLTIDNETQEQAKSKAREGAVGDAKKKAAELAKLSGRKLGKVVKITETGDFGYPQPILARSSADLAEKATSISPGENEVTINLAVDFSLK